jgi:branched-chain amino acid transport system ATP-binding protein
VLALLEVRNINVYYDGIQAVQDVSLNVAKGEIVAIVGPNGSGKTTILKTIQGLLHPKSGEIIFQGRRIDRLQPHQIVELGITYVPEGRKIFPYMTVKENLEIAAYTKNARANKEETLELVYSLFPVLKKRGSELGMNLSGGEQRMLALGRGLMTGSQLLLLDDPFMGLAPKIISCTCDIIRAISSKGITILIVGQHVRQILNLAKRAYLIESGRITLEGKGEELLMNEYVRKILLGF